MKTLNSNFKRLFIMSKTLLIGMHTLILTILVTATPIYADRFDPPSLKIAVDDFDKRANGDIFNVDFLLAHIVNNTRKTIREVGEITDAVDGILQNTTVFTNTNNGNGIDSATAGSVVIPPGTSADTIIILNQNEGDSIAIQR